jgi:mono/diheme cytochrome c family protein
MTLKNILPLCGIAFLRACSSSSGEQTEADSSTADLDRRDQLRFKQYKVQGAKIYQTYCQNCHQADGKGLASLYPPLAGADYLLENMPRAACIIKNGQAKEIVVNGKTYNQMMPGNPITNIEVAEVLTFIGNNWGNDAGFISVKEVDKWLKECEDY